MGSVCPAVGGVEGQRQTFFSEDLKEGSGLQSGPILRIIPKNLIREPFSNEGMQIGKTA